MTTTFDSVMPISSSTEEKWTNWGGNQSCTPAYTIRPRTEQEVLDAVRFAIKEGLPVRAVGAGHSFTPIVQTGGVLLDLQHLSGLTDTDSARNRVRMYGGTRISDIGESLWARGMSLTNQGDIDKQAIAGAIATATHGSGAELGSFSSAVRWAKVINGHGEIVEVGENDIRELKAAQVAIGTLGIMVEVELQASPAYHIIEEITYPMFDEVEKHWDENVRDHRHYSFIWCQEDGSAEMYELPTPAGESMVNRTYTKKYRAAELDEATGLSSVEGARRDRAYRIYAGGYMIPFHELEYYVPAEVGLDAVKAVQNLLLTKHTDQKYPLEVRWVKGEDAYISPFYKRDTTVLSVSGAPGTDYWPYLRDLDSLLQDFDARAHWGKIHFMNRERMMETFPEYDTFVQVRREFDPHGVFLNDHLRSLVG